MEAVEEDASAVDAWAEEVCEHCVAVVEGVTLSSPNPFLLETW